MNKEKQTQLEVETKLEALNDMLNKLSLMRVGTHQTQAEDQITKKIAEIRKAFNSLNDQSYKTTKLKGAFDNLVETFTEFQREANHEGEEEVASPTVFESEDIDLETEKKRRDLDDLRELNKLSTEMVLQQNLINQKIKEDGENIESLVVDTESTIESGNKAIRNVAEASKYERKTRLFALQTGGTAVGGIFGNAFGAVGGLFITGGISRWIGKKHQKKLDKVVNM